MWKVLNVWNTERTVPFTEEDKFLKQKIEVNLGNTVYEIQVYDTLLGSRWLDALNDNLAQKRILEKNFCFLGFADSKRDLRYLVGEVFHR